MANIGKHRKIITRIASKGEFLAKVNTRITKVQNRKNAPGRVKARQNNRKNEDTRERIKPKDQITERGKNRSPFSDDYQNEG